MGYIGTYNTTGEDFIIGEVRIGGLILEKMILSEYNGPHFEKYINPSEYLNGIIPSKGFFVIGYMGNCKDEAKEILVELLSQDKTKRFSTNLYFSEETETYYGSYKITKRFGGMCDCLIIPDKFLSHLCDMLVVISDQTFKDGFSYCNIL